MALVLIVDDNQDIRILMDQLLEASGFEVIQAAGGREALSLLRSEDPLPDAIVLDVQMPSIDGWDTLKEIRLDERSIDIPVLLCTVKGSQIDRARGWQLGCDGYITKPFDAEDFIAAVRVVVGLSPESPGRIGDDRDRSAEDRDERAEAHDQESEARDQRAEARDEAAVSDRAAAFRDRRGAASDRMQAADDREGAAAEDRDERADAHDQESENRDERDQARDQRAEARDEAAVSDRAAAFRDRRVAASDRMQAADDREAAAGDRVTSARERVVSSIDELTGAYRRDAGTLELERETVRAKRTNRPLVLAFVDVDGLKATNDSLGHAAGDRLLRGTVDSMRTYLRSYDLIVRFGGDEFVTALLDMSMSEAAKRFEAINADLAETEHGSITVGLAELRLEDSLGDLIARADEALYMEREQQPRA